MVGLPGQGEISIGELSWIDDWLFDLCMMIRMIDVCLKMNSNVMLEVDACDFQCLEAST